jgi:hypothetical protein
MVEGHVPQGVGVQVPPSAQKEYMDKRLKYPCAEKRRFFVIAEKMPFKTGTWFTPDIIRLVKFGGLIHDR